jgi:hypothetical protein
MTYSDSTCEDTAIRRSDKSINQIVMRYSCVDSSSDLACRRWIIIRSLSEAEGFDSWNPPAHVAGLLFLSADVLVNHMWKGERKRALP